MKAAVLEDIARMVVKEVDTPVVKEKTMLVKVKGCAVCGSDIRIFHFGNPRVNPPQIIGHEIAGEVVEVGKGVTGFSIGDRVAIGADVPCGECEFCRAGQGNNCPINYAIGYQFPGGFAEYILLNSLTLRLGPVHKIPKNLSYEEAALAEPLACVIHGLELSQLKIGESILIIGAGPVGGMMADLAKAMGAGKVLLAQRSQKRIELARRFLADVIISTTEEDLTQRVMEETGAQGVDVVVTACASVEAQEQALTVVRNRGRVNFFGGLPRGSHPLSVDSNLIHYRECFVHGSHGSVPSEHKKALELIERGVVEVKKIITHRFPLEDIHQAFQEVENREGLKVMVIP